MVLCGCHGHQLFGIGYHFKIIILEPSGYREKKLILRPAVTREGKITAKFQSLKHEAQLVEHRAVTRKVMSSTPA